MHLGCLHPKKRTYPKAFLRSSAWMAIALRKGQPSRRILSHLCSHPSVSASSRSTCPLPLLQGRANRERAPGHGYHHVNIILGIAVGSTMKAEAFLHPPPADFYPRPGRSLLLNLFLKEKANPSSARPVLPRYPWQRGYPRGPICRRIRRTTSSCMQRDRTLQGLSAPQ